MAISTNPIWQLRFNQGADSAYNPFVPPKPATQAPAAKPQLPVIGSPQPMRSAANDSDKDDRDPRLMREYTGDFFSWTPGPEIDPSQPREPGTAYEEYESAMEAADFFQGPINLGTDPDEEAGLQMPGVGWGLSKVADFFTGGLASAATQGLTAGNEYMKRKDAVQFRKDNPDAAMPEGIQYRTDFAEQPGERGSGVVEKPGPGGTGGSGITRRSNVVKSNRQQKEKNRQDNDRGGFAKDRKSRQDKGGFGGPGGGAAY